jgi:hypothetical protein
VKQIVCTCFRRLRKPFRKNSQKDGYPGSKKSRAMRTLRGRRASETFRHDNRTANWFLMVLNPSVRLCEISNLIQ